MVIEEVHFSKWNQVANPEQLKIDWDKITKGKDYIILVMNNSRKKTTHTAPSYY